MKKNKILDRMADFLLACLPRSWKRRWDSVLDLKFAQMTVGKKENLRKRIVFQRQQILIAFWGILLVLLLALYVVIQSFSHKPLIFTRNPFGKGEQEIELELEKEGKTDRFTIELEEQKLTKKQEDRMYLDFARDLKKAVLGKNTSFSKVNQSLNLVEEVEGYPFQIEYQVENEGVIDWNGNLGEQALSLKEGQSLKTILYYQASYKEYFYENRLLISVIAPEKKKLTIFERWKNRIISQENHSRNQEDFVLDPQDYGGMLKNSAAGKIIYLPGLLLIAMILYLIKGYTDIKEKEKRRHRENMEDFPLIVHLLTLYMGAGLSFSSAVSRIGKDYEKNHMEGKERFSFEQILVMDRCMHMGMRPKEACLNWGNHFKEKAYAKFAMLLAQSFSKGAKEIRSMMEKEQQDAFQVQIDYVRRAGEEASTRLLFPMIVLLFIIMLLVMFPAMMQFYSI